jgi:hypothetical protein
MHLEIISALPALALLHQAGSARCPRAIPTRSQQPSRRIASATSGSLMFATAMSGISRRGRGHVRRKTAECNYPRSRGKETGQIFGKTPCRNAPEGRRPPSGPGSWEPVARSPGYFTWTPIGSLRSPDDSSCAFAPLLDPSRIDVPLPWRSHQCCPRLEGLRGLRTMITISGLTYADSEPVLLRFALRVAARAQGWLPAGWPLPALWITTEGFWLHFPAPSQPQAFA